jgi:hypothetical protein
MAPVIVDVSVTGREENVGKSIRGDPATKSVIWRLGRDGAGRVMRRLAGAARAVRLKDSRSRV